MMASNHKPRITYEAIVEVGKFLDAESPTKQDWRVFASYLGFTDTWIQSTESKCLPTGKSPTAYVLRAWEEWFEVLELLPVREQLIACLKKMNRKDAASTIEELMKDGTFLRSVKSSPHSKTHSFSGFSGCVPTSHQTHCCTCQTGQQTSHTNDSTGRSKKSAQEDSYYGRSNSYLPQGYPERCIDCERRKKAPTGPWEHQLNSPAYYQPHQPKNGQSVVSLSSAISDKSENLPVSSHRNNTKTWPLKKGNDMNTGTHDRRLSPGHVASRREIQYQPNSMELETLFRPESNYHPQLSQYDDRPFHSLVSTTSMDRYDHGDGGAHAAHGRYSVTEVDRMMMENPERASPNQNMKNASVLITYAYKNYQAAHKLAKLLIDEKHEVKVDTKAPIKDLAFTSVTYVIIIYTPEYVNEVIGKVKSPLNTRNIYIKMDEEFRRQGNRNFRFVPLFDHDRISSDSIPRLLRNYPEQPLQYICKILDPSQDTPKQDTPKRGEIPIQTIIYSSR